MEAVVAAPRLKSREALPTRPEDRARPEVRRRMSAPAMRTFFNIADKWALSGKEQIAILGAPAASTFYKYKAGDVGTLSLDLLTRVSLVLGIYKDLHILFPDASLADRWIKLPNANPMFGGKTPAGFLAQGEMDCLYRLRRLLDARRGG